MRIGIDATILQDDKPTGIGLFTINLIRSLAKIHNNIVVWSINGELLAGMHIEMRSVLSRYKNSRICHLIRFFWSQSILPALIRKESVDIFVSPIPQGVVRCPASQIIVFHDLLPLIWPRDFPLYTRISFRYFLPQVLKNSVLIMSVSEQTREDILRYYGVDEDKVKVIRECIDFNLFKRYSDKKTIQHILNKYGLEYKRYVLFVGTLTYRKNLHTLIRAYKEVLLDHSGLKLVIAGKSADKEYQSYINELVVKDNLFHHVFFLGYIPFEELPCLYSGARVFVYPSIYEGFGLPVLESICCGTAVSSSKNVPCARAIENVFTFSPESRSELSTALRYFIESDLVIPDGQIEKLKKIFSCSHMGNQVMQEIRGLM